MGWLVWVVGVVLLVAAGFGAAYLPRARAASLNRRAAWAGARAAVESATISRDAAPRDLPQADELLARAELLLANRGGTAAAVEAAACAAKADQLWREAAGE